MIASVRGQVSHVGLDNVVIEVGGVGVLVHVTPATATSLRTGSTAYLATSLVVREDSLTLYGFADADGRSVFETVQTAVSYTHLDVYKRQARRWYWLSTSDNADLIASSPV